MKLKFKFPILKLGIDWLRLKYKIKAFFVFIPSFGLRNERTNKVFDAWLWDRLKSHQPSHIDSYTCRIDGRCIWISNYPYASGNLYERPRRELYCSRATAVRLHDVLKSHFGAIKADVKRIKREKKAEAKRIEREKKADEKRLEREKQAALEAEFKIEP